MSAPPSKQLSANAPEFIPRGFTLNILHNISSNNLGPQQQQQQGNFFQPQTQQQQHHTQYQQQQQPQQQQPHHQALPHHQQHHHHQQQQQQQPHHHHHHHHHNHHGQSVGSTMRDLPNQMNSLRLTNNAMISTVQDRLQIYRGQHQHYQQQPQLHPQSHEYNNMQNQQFSGRGGGGGGGGGNGGGGNGGSGYKWVHYNNSHQQRFMNGGPQQQHSSHSNNTNANNSQHQQHQQHQQQQQPPPPPPQNSTPTSIDPNQQTEEETFAVNYVESLINCLNENPGSFDSITASALTIFEGFGTNEYILSNAMEMIFNRSIEEQNFRYMGAKLYGLLDLIDLREDSSFRMLLHLKLDYHRNEILKYMQNEQAKVRGTTLFLAELYMQLRNDGNRIKDIAQNIVFSINQLLRKITPENMKCICLTLKLAGYDLEFDCPQDMASIIQTLSSVNALDVSTSRILENVLSLQKNKWGRMSEPPAAVIPTFNNANNVRLSDDPVFYGPDGQILTEEESSFLVSNLPSNNDADDSGSDLDPEMDAESKKCYKMFLAHQHQTNQQQFHHL